MQNRAGPTCDIWLLVHFPLPKQFLEFFGKKKYFSDPLNFFRAALSEPVRMVWSAPVTGWGGANTSQPLLAGPTCEISSTNLEIGAIRRIITVNMGQKNDT